MKHTTIDHTGRMKHGWKRSTPFVATGALLATSVLFLSGGMLGPVAHGDVVHAENDGPISEEPIGDGLLNIALVLPGEKLTGENLAAWNGADVAVRDINRVAGLDHLGGEKTQTNTVHGLHIDSFSRHFFPENPDEAEPFIAELAESGVDVIVTLRSSEPGAAAVERAASASNIPIFYADDIDHFSGLFPSVPPVGLNFKNPGNAKLLVEALGKQLVDDRATSVVYAYLPDVTGNAIRRELERQLPGLLGGNKPSIPKKEDTAEGADSSDRQDPAENDADGNDAAENDANGNISDETAHLLPLYFDPANLENFDVKELAQKIVALGSSHIAIHLADTDADITLSMALLEALGAEGVDVSQIVFVGMNQELFLNEDQSVPEALVEHGTAEGLRFVADSRRITPEFVKQLKLADPWASTNVVSELVYESVIRIQLARTVAADDNGKEILAEARVFAGNNNDCYSYQECAYVLNYTPKINYRGTGTSVQTWQVQADNSLLVLNSSNEVK